MNLPNNRISIIWIIVIIGFAALLRFYRVTDYPPSLTHDETAIAYNAYSILQTGKDEYGISLPLLFRSFDDYKLPGMVYITIPFVAIFGLNELGVRFPSAFFGTLTVLIFIFLIKDAFANSVKLNVGKLEIPLYYVSGFLLAVSPWHINFSRQLFESNGALFFLVLGIWLLIRGRTRPVIWILSAISLAIAFYFYYSVRVVIPPVLVSFLAVNFRLVKKNIKYASAALLTFILVLSPFIPSLLSNGGMARIGMVSVINDSKYSSRLTTYTNRIADNPSVINRIIYNRRVALLETIIGNYLSNLSYAHVFQKGAGSSGLQYYFEFPLILSGLFLLLISKNPLKWVFLTWVLSVPLVGAFSVNQPNSLRNLPNAPMFSLVSSLGLYYLVQTIRNQVWRIAIFAGFVVVFTCSFISFANGYFTNGRLNALSYGDGYKQMAEYSASLESTYDTIWISGYYWRPYIFLLFWKNYDPKLYQVSGNRDGFGKFRFSNAPWDHSGVSFHDKNIDLPKASNNRAIYIVSPTEYQIHESELIKVASIDGKHAKDVFIVGIPNHP